MAIVKAIYVTFGDIKDMDLEDFIRTQPYIKKMVFDRIYFNKKYKVELIETPIVTSETGLPLKTMNQLYIDGVKFETGQKYSSL